VTLEGAERWTGKGGIYKDKVGGELKE